MIIEYLPEDTYIRNRNREMNQRKAKTNMGDIHHRYVWYDGSSKQSCGGHASITQTRQVTRATHVRNRVCPRVELIIIITLLIIFLGFIKSKPC